MEIVCLSDLCDHLFCKLTMYGNKSRLYITSNINSAKVEKRTAIKWDDNKVEIFQKELSSYECLVFDDNNCVASQYDNFISILHVVAGNCQMVKEFFHKNDNSGLCANSKKPWFNDLCRQKKKELRKLKMKIKGNYSDEQIVRLFLSERTDYRRLIKKSKKEYLNQITEILSNVTNSGDFWKTVKAIGYAPRKINPISIERWTEY